MQGIDAACQTYFDQYVATQGAMPTHNQFVEAVMQHGVSRTKARKDYQMLRGQRPTTPTREAMMTPQDAHDEPADQPSMEPQGSLAARLAQQRLETHALQAELQELRALVMTLAPRPNGPAPDVQPLGKALADLALLQRQMQHLTDEHTRLAQQVADLAQTVEPFQALRTLLSKDEVAWDCLKSMLRHSDNWTQHKPTYNWLAAWCGRPLHTPQM